LSSDDCGQRDATIDGWVALSPVLVVPLFCMTAAFAGMACASALSRRGCSTGGCAGSSA